jgi:hypothetical protein
MLTDPSKYDDARDAATDRLRTAAWLQYLIEHADDGARAGGTASGVAAAASHRIGERSHASLRREAAAMLADVAPWVAADGGACACESSCSRDSRGTCVHVPTAEQLEQAERRCAGSRAVFESAHGVIDAWSFDDPDVGWAALERIVRGGVRDAERDPREPDELRELSESGDARRAKNLRERAAAAAAREPMPMCAGAAIDAAVLRIAGPRDDASRIDEMAALAMFAATLACGKRISTDAYGGAHNLIARAIRSTRRDLASVDGLLAALSVCRLERLVGAGSFWAYYLLAGIAIAAPDVVREFGRRFHRDAWHTWLDDVLAWPAVDRFGPKEEFGYARLRDAMSLTSRSNPIVRVKRTRAQAVARAPFSTNVGKPR